MESGVSENAVSGHIQLIVPGTTACFAVCINKFERDKNYNYIEKYIVVCSTIDSC